MVDRETPSSNGADNRSREEQLRAILARLHLMALARSVDRTGRRLHFVGVNLLRKLARLPLVGPGIDPLLARLDNRDRLHFDLVEVLRVCAALNEEQLAFWITGGWGLDALAGCETRRHSDLDFALDRFQEDLPKAARVLTRLGYRRKMPLGGTIWFPDAETFEDERGHHIEVLSISWNVLSMAGILLDPSRGGEFGSEVVANWATPRLLEQCTATGYLEGVAVPTLSVVAQQLFHLGYKDRRSEDSHADDLIRLLQRGDTWINPITDGGSKRAAQEDYEPSTLLLVPIFNFPPDLWRLCRIYHNNLNLIPPHVTLAFPFLPLESITTAVIERLSEVFANYPAFDFTLDEVRWFGTDVVYLEPSNSEVFRTIVEALQKEFPDFHPYNDEFESVIPHVCLSEHGTIADRRLLARHSPTYLPIPNRAAHVWMMCNDIQPDQWSIVKIFALDSK